MIALALLAAAVSAAPDQDSCNSRPGDFGLVERAMCYEASVSPYPELVRFRNLHTVGDYVCGEVNRPWGERMAGFHRFIYIDVNNSAEQTPQGLSAVIRGRSDSVGLFNEKIRRADALGRPAYAQRRDKFAAEAAEMLGACAAQLDPD